MESPDALEVQLALSEMSTANMKLLGIINRLPLNSPQRKDLLDKSILVTEMIQDISDIAGANIIIPPTN